MREIILDTETTGLDPSQGHKIIEIGCVELVNRVKTGKFFHCYVNPEREVPQEAFRIHGISTEFLLDKKVFKDIVNEFLEFISNDILVIHNAKFDIKFINHELKLLNSSSIGFDRVVDTLDIARRKFPGSPANLDALCKRFKVDLSARNKHGALLDAELLSDVYINLLGGNQSSMIPNENKVNNEKNLDNLSREFKADRNFSIDQEELDDHKEFVSKISNNIW